MKTITLELDDLDYDAVQSAMARRQAFGGGGLWPDPASDSRELGEKREQWNEPSPLADGSNVAGLCIAEICRGWMEMLDMGQG
jgi:hypothetical protein